jgi:hypothetical protein
VESLHFSQQGTASRYNLEQGLSADVVGIGKLFSHDMNIDQPCNKTSTPMT